MKPIRRFKVSDEGAEYECVRGVVVVFYGSGVRVKTIGDSLIMLSLKLNVRFFFYDY